jgi:hypothetical protein
MDSCRENLSGKSSKIDCNEVCKFTRAYSSEQKPAQKAEEKPVERSLSVEEQKPVEEKPVEESVSKKVIIAIFSVWPFCPMRSPRVNLAQSQSTRTRWLCMIAKRTFAMDLIVAEAVVIRIFLLEALIATHSANTLM